MSAAAWTTRGRCVGDMAWLDRAYEDKIADCHKCVVPMPMPLPNVWIGVTVEDLSRADLRIPALLDTPAAVRFLSCEPLLGPVRLACSWLGQKMDQGPRDPRIDWVIVGGESGPDARPMHPDWARGLRDQCQDAGVPFFFKQWGEWGLVPDIEGNGDKLALVGKRSAGRELDGRTWDEEPS